MQTTRINITLPNELAKDLRRSIPARSRSKFIAKVLAEKLTKKKWTKKEWIKSLKANQEFYKQVAEEWKYVDAEAFEKLP